MNPWFFSSISKKDLLPKSAEPLWPRWLAVQIRSLSPWNLSSVGRAVDWKSARPWFDSRRFHDRKKSRWGITLLSGIPLALFQKSFIFNAFIDRFSLDIYIRQCKYKRNGWESNPRCIAAWTDFRSASLWPLGYRSICCQLIARMESMGTEKIADSATRLSTVGRLSPCCHL